MFSKIRVRDEFYLGGGLRIHAKGEDWWISPVHVEGSIVMQSIGPSGNFMKVANEVKQPLIGLNTIEITDASLGVDIWRVFEIENGEETQHLWSYANRELMEHGKDDLAHNAQNLSNGLRSASLKLRDC